MSRRDSTGFQPSLFEKGTANWFDVPRDLQPEVLAVLAQLLADLQKTSKPHQEEKTERERKN